MSLASSGALRAPGCLLKRTKAHKGAQIPEAPCKNQVERARKPGATLENPALRLACLVSPPVFSPGRSWNLCAFVRLPAPGPISRGIQSGSRESQVFLYSFLARLSQELALAMISLCPAFRIFVGCAPGIRLCKWPSTAPHPNSLQPLGFRGRRCCTYACNRELAPGRQTRSYKSSCEDSASLSSESGRP